MQAKKCPECGRFFKPHVAHQRYCDEHKNSHATSKLIDRRKLGSQARPGYYRKRPCEDCAASFEPTSGNQKRCPKCRPYAWERHNRAKSLESSRRAARRYRHIKVFGDPEIYEKCIERYGEQCAICGVSPEAGMHLAIDHDHAGGTVRGLLCQRCNTGLGYFRDQPERLRSAAAYLEGHLL